MKKVLFVANSSWYLNNFRRSTIEKFASHFEVSCMFSRGKEKNLLTDLNVKKHPVFLYPASSNLFFEIITLIHMFYIISVNRPKIVFSFNPKTNLYSLVICWLLRIPCVPNVSGVGNASMLSGLKGSIYNIMCKFFYNRAHFIYFQNSSDYNRFISNKWGVSTKAEIIPGSGVNLKEFKPNNVFYPENTKRLKFLMASRLIKPKGVLEYISAVETLKKENVAADFYLAGVIDNSKRAINPSIISELSITNDLEYLGNVTNMSQLLKDIDCVVLPSYYPEGIPRILIEALASGLVIITTNTNGCRETVVDSYNGYFVEPKCSTDLANTMRKLSELSPHQIYDMKVKSRNIAVEKFDEVNIINSYLDVAFRLT